MIFVAYRPSYMGMDGWGRDTGWTDERELGFVVAPSEQSALRRARKMWTHDGSWNIVKVRYFGTDEVHVRMARLRSELQDLEDVLAENERIES